MSPAAFGILKLSFAFTYLCLLYALLQVLRMSFSGDVFVPGGMSAVYELLRLPQGIMLVGVIGSGIAEDLSRH
jgi:hypothetical protein